MKRDSGIFIATVGTLSLAIMCCVGLPLIAAAVATVDAGALFVEIGVAACIAILAGIVLALRWRQRV